MPTDSPAKSSANICLLIIAPITFIRSRLHVPTSDLTKGYADSPPKKLARQKLLVAHYPRHETLSARCRASKKEVSRTDAKLRRFFAGGAVEGFAADVAVVGDVVEADADA